MAVQITTNINVDFYDKKYIMVNAKQYDGNSRWITITCYNDGSLFNLNANKHTAYIRYKKADEYNVFNICRINQKGEVLVELTEQMLAADGICYADLIIVNKGSAIVNVDTGEIITIDDSAILSTMAFCVNVYESAVDNSLIESSYEYDALNNLLQGATADYKEVVQLAKSYAIGDANNIRENEDFDNSKYYSQLSKSYAIGDTDSIRENEDIDNAKYYYEQSLESANNASQSEINAAKSETNALKSENNTKTYLDKSAEYMNNARASETSAIASENAARGYATTAQNSMNSALNSASSASTSAANAYNHYLQAEAITNGLNGAFLPKGTITFAELLELKDNGAVAAGDLYQISDDFTTDENFRMSGKVCGAGTSVYYTVDDQFDCFVGATVAGVKGENETGYRTGMVNITSENIGAVSNADVATVDEMKNYLGI